MRKKEFNKEISRREFLNKQFLTPLALISILFNEEEKDNDETFDVDKLSPKDKKLFQQLAG